MDQNTEKLMAIAQAMHQGDIDLARTRADKLIVTFQNGNVNMDDLWYFVYTQMLEAFGQDYNSVSTKVRVLCMINIMAIRAARAEKQLAELTTVKE